MSIYDLQIDFEPARDTRSAALDRTWKKLTADRRQSLEGISAPIARGRNAMGILHERNDGMSALLTESAGQ